MDLDLKIATTFTERQSYLRRKVPHVSALTTLFLYYPHICENSQFVRQTDGSQYVYKRTDPCIPLNTITAPLIMEMEEYFKSLISASMQVTGLRWTHESNRYTVRFQFCDRTGQWVEISAYSAHKPTAMALLLARCGKSDRFQALSSSAALVSNKRPMPTTRERRIGAASDANVVSPSETAAVEETSPVVQSSDQNQHRDAQQPLQFTATISVQDVLRYMPYTLGRALRSIICWAHVTHDVATSARYIRVAIESLEISQQRPGVGVSPVAVALYRLLYEANKESRPLYIGLFIVEEKLATALQLLREEQERL
jgi:hypothetical protein